MTALITALSSTDNRIPPAFPICSISQNSTLKPVVVRVLTGGMILLYGGQNDRSYHSFVLNGQSYSASISDLQYKSEFHPQAGRGKGSHWRHDTPVRRPE